MKRLIILAILLLALAGCSEHFATFEEAVLAHRYYLLQEYNDPDWTLDDVVVVSTTDSGYACGFQFCYSYMILLFRLGDPAGVHVDRNDGFILIDGDEAGWQYADWL